MKNYFPCILQSNIYNLIKSGDGDPSQSMLIRINPIGLAVSAWTILRHRLCNNSGSKKEPCPPEGGNRN